MTTKVCTVCKIEKSTSEFYLTKDFRNPTGKGIYVKPLCKVCDKINSRLQKSRSRERKRVFLWEYKKTHPCVDCGESNPLCLQFDHVNGDKTMNVGEMSGGGHSLQTLKNEIAKCVVRCANCHLKKTAKDQGWYGVELQSEGVDVDEWNKRYSTEKEQF